MATIMIIKQFRWFLTKLLLVAAMAVPSVAMADSITPTKPTEGNGSSGNPYKITSEAELYWFARLVNGDKSVCDYNATTNPSGTKQNLSAHAILTEDIEMNSEIYWTPIGNEKNPFVGMFDGKNHSIVSLNCNNAQYAGFVGYMGNAGIIQGVKLERLNIVGEIYTGGVCGYNNNGKIHACFTSGLIECGNYIGGICGRSDGNESQIISCNNDAQVAPQITTACSGGLCGYLDGGEIYSCCNSGTITGGNYSGGLCGYFNNGTVSYSYNIGEIELSEHGGEFYGFSNNKTCYGCYYLAETANEDGGRTSEQFHSGEVCLCLQNGTGGFVGYYGTAWGQFLGEDPFPVVGSNWLIFDGYDQDCILTYSNYPDVLDSDPTHDHDNGICTVCGAYQPATQNKSGEYEIGNYGQLCWFAGLVNGTLKDVSQNLSACAKLTDNITVNKNVLNENGELNSGTFTSWTPIGPAFANPYSGTFDGNGYTISGLYINASSNGIGLFGFNSGTIKNLGVVDSYVSGAAWVGGVCGRNKSGTIEACHYQGKVSGDACIGGICGYNGALSGKAIINRCHNVGTIYGVDRVGGVCGINQANITGSETAEATITDSYNTGSVNGIMSNESDASTHVGGVCGYNDARSESGTAKATITGCYSSGAVSCQGTLVGGVCAINCSDGKSSTTATIMNCCYDNEKCNCENAVYENEDGTVENVMGKTTAQFASGNVCHLLNGSSPYGAWGQQLNIDSSPVLGSPYKVIMTAQNGISGSDYWATFSNKGSHAELSAPADNVTVYNATVSNGKMILSERSDNRVAAGEGVLLKAYCEYVNAKNISEPVTAAATVDNDLLPTPTEAGVISEAGYKYYRLTYNDVATKDKLGFYLGVVGESQDGSQLKATPGKAYLMLSSSNENAKVRGFVLPGDDGETTGVECITVADEAPHTDVIFDLQGRKLSKPAKGMYIKNNRVVFKLKN